MYNLQKITLLPFFVESCFFGKKNDENFLVLYFCSNKNKKTKVFFVFN